MSFVLKSVLEDTLSDTSITAILASLGSKLAIPKINDSIKKLTTGKINSNGQNAGLQSLSNTLKAKSDSWRAAANNARQAIDALLVAEASLNEIASLAQRLEELGALYNNSLLSTTDIASFNAETATITSNIDSIVSGTSFNGVSMLGTSKISFTAGVTDDGGTISLNNWYSCSSIICNRSIKCRYIRCSHNCSSSFKSRRNCRRNTITQS